MPCPALFHLIIAIAIINARCDIEQTNKKSKTKSRHPAECPDHPRTKSPYHVHILTDIYIHFDFPLPLLHSHPLPELPKSQAKPTSAITRIVFERPPAPPPKSDGANLNCCCCAHTGGSCFRALMRSFEREVGGFCIDRCIFGVWVVVGIV